ncbi:hypothetical protein FA13DRAFT_1149512 [Coprinellus micaceus]|uniref:Uncharacterized protein n=1 Tax=Coprinellus micaceus TaxID=71717 RepID=A0A4Y7SUT5_COPMI|nr:hypothetical protein FA13DRAFT_1149512 [Coprinellus micaceus]
MKAASQIRKEGPACHCAFHLPPHPLEHSLPLPTPSPAQGHSFTLNRSKGPVADTETALDGKHNRQNDTSQGSHPRLLRREGPTLTTSVQTPWEVKTLIPSYRTVITMIPPRRGGLPPNARNDLAPYRAVCNMVRGILRGFVKSQDLEVKQKACNTLGNPA